MFETLSIKSISDNIYWRKLKHSKVVPVHHAGTWLTKIYSHSPH